MKDTSPTPPLHPHAHPEGGQACPDGDLLKHQRDTVAEWLKAMGQRLFAGKVDLLSTPFPVKMFEPRSYLEKLADPWGVEPRLLKEAASTSDPARRMALIIAHFVAGIHVAFEKWQKPFNPILGETWQANLESDGISISMEQISHHPPISAFYMEGQGFQLVGQSQPSIQLSLRDQGFKSRSKVQGYRYVRFADGSKIDIYNPGFVFKNIMGASKPRAEVFGTAYFADTRHNLCGMLQFGGLDKGSNGLKHRSDVFMGGIYDVTGTPMADPAWIMQQQEASSSTGSDASDEAPSPLTLDAGSKSAADDKQQQQQQQEQWLVQQLHQQEQQQQQHAGNSTKPSSGLFSGLSKLVSSKAPSSANGSTMRSMGAALKATLGSMKLPQRQQQQQQQAELAGPEECGSMGKMMMGLEGSWLSHLNAGGERLWTWATEVCKRFSPVETPLPSDSRFRQDLAALREGDMAEAGRWKVLLEQQQRADKALRETGRGG